MYKLCTWRIAPNKACRCPNGLRSDTPRVIVRHWKDGKTPTLGSGEAMCDQHGSEVPEWMIAKGKSNG